MNFIYLITSPSGKKYVGKSSILQEQKIDYYQRSEISSKKNDMRRLIVMAIKKYGWKNMKFEVIDSENWTPNQTNEKEKYWINVHNCVSPLGYNMTMGGDGLDSSSASSFWKNYHKNLSEEKRQIRNQNCSKGQLKRFKENPDSMITKRRKSDSHKGSYRIESPDGTIYITEDGLKDFVEKNKNKINITYWKLIAAYRKCYNNIETNSKRKNANKWKVVRLDK